MIKSSDLKLIEKKARDDLQYAEGVKNKDGVIKPFRLIHSSRQILELVKTLEDLNKA